MKNNSKDIIEKLLNINIPYIGQKVTLGFTNYWRIRKIYPKNYKEKKCRKEGLQTTCTHYSYSFDVNNKEDLHEPPNYGTYCMKFFYETRKNT